MLLNITGAINNLAAYAAISDQYQNVPYTME